MTAFWKVSSIVKALRDQSQEAPRRFNWLMIVSPDCSFHSQTLARKASRPISRREGCWVFASSRSTTICVAMPAWSWPGCQSVSKPRIRCQRTRISCSVLLNAWPMCSEPVTFGGGIMMQKVSSREAFAPAAKQLRASHSCAIRASAVAASKVFSMVIVRILFGPCWGRPPRACPVLSRCRCFISRGREGKAFSAAARMSCQGWDQTARSSFVVRWIRLSELLTPGIAPIVSSA